MNLLHLLLDFAFFDKLSDKFFIRLLIDFIAMFILIRFIYFPHHKNKDFVFTFFLFNFLIFIITYLLNKVDMSMGAAFGLFAVFSILRYRTEGISMKDMTYLFIVIAMGLISAVGKTSYFELCLLQALILLVIFALDGNLIMKNELTKIVQYENIELIKPENKTLLMEDLKKRTGINIHQITILKIDFLRDVAIIKIFYYEI